MDVLESATWKGTSCRSRPGKSLVLVLLVVGGEFLAKCSVRTVRARPEERWARAVLCLVGQHSINQALERLELFQRSCDAKLVDAPLTIMAGAIRWFEARNFRQDLRLSSFIHLLRVDWGNQPCDSLVPDASKCRAGADTIIQHSPQPT